MLTEFDIEPIPTDIEVKIIGTIIIFNNLINISPRGIKICEDSKSNETITPRSIAISICINCLFNIFIIKKGSYWSLSFRRGNINIT